MLLALLYARPSVAQTDSLTREVGFSTQIIFDNIFQSGVAPFELMLKKKKNESKWMRYGIGLSVFQGKDKDSPNAINEHTYFQTSITPSLGMEKRVMLAEKWKFLYGGDIFTGFDYRESESFQKPQPDIENRQEEDYYSVSAGVRPFLGIIFSITPRLSVSTEASAALRSSWGKRKSSSTHYNTTNELDEKFRSSHLGLRPASAIFVYYRF